MTDAPEKIWVYSPDSSFDGMCDVSQVEFHDAYTYIREDIHLTTIGAVIEEAVTLAETYEDWCAGWGEDKSLAVAQKVSGEIDEAIRALRPDATEALDRIVQEAVMAERERCFARGPGMSDLVKRLKYDRDCPSTYFEDEPPLFARDHWNDDTAEKCTNCGAWMTVVRPGKTQCDCCGNDHETAMRWEAADRIEALEAERDRLREALEEYMEHDADYARLNNLGDHTKSHRWKRARAALKETADD